MYKNVQPPYFNINTKVLAKPAADIFNSCAPTQQNIFYKILLYNVLSFLSSSYKSSALMLEENLEISKSIHAIIHSFNKYLSRVSHIKLNKIYQG